MKDLTFDYEILKVNGFTKPITYLRVSMKKGNDIYSTDCRVYWFDIVWGLPFAKLNILKRINKK